MRLTNKRKKKKKIQNNDGIVIIGYITCYMSLNFKVPVMDAQTSYHVGLRCICVCLNFERIKR